MIKTLIKHLVYEKALDVLFDGFARNLVSAIPDMIFKKGDRFKYIEFDFMGYICKMRDIVVVDVAHSSLLGQILVINTEDPFLMIEGPTFGLHKDFGISDKTIQDTIQVTMAPCEDCYHKDSYYLKSTVAISPHTIIAIK